MTTDILLLAVAVAVIPAWFAWDVRKAGGVRALNAALTGAVLPPAPEIPGQPGWTRAQWADPAYGVDRKTGEPRYDVLRRGTP